MSIYTLSTVLHILWYLRTLFTLHTSRVPWYSSQHGHSPPPSYVSQNIALLFFEVYPKFMKAIATKFHAMFLSRLPSQTSKHHSILGGTAWHNVTKSNTRCITCWMWGTGRLIHFSFCWTSITASNMYCNKVCEPVELKWKSGGSLALTSNLTFVFFVDISGSIPSNVFK